MKRWIPCLLVPLACSCASNQTSTDEASTPPPASTTAVTPSAPAPRPVPAPAPVDRSPSTVATPSSPSSISAEGSGRGERVVTVRRGDTLGAIAKRSGVSVRELMEWNDIANPNRLRVGQELRIRAPE